MLPLSWATPQMEWPNQYLTGKAQLERNLARAAQMAINV